MPFYTHRDVEVFINNKKIIANSMEISQSVDISHPIFQGESVSSRNVVNSPIIGSLRLSYYLTGLDPLKDYLYSNSSYPLSGNICGMTFNNGYLGSYSINAEPNAPIDVNIEIPFFDELVGSFYPIVASGITDIKVLNFNDSYFNYNSSYSTNSLSSNSITNFQWNYKADIQPIYYYAQEGITNLRPDRISINEKNISAQITCDSSAIPLSFMGENFAIELKCPSPTDSNIYELYACSGLINQRNFSLDSSSLSKTTFEISQSHLNSTPLIGSVVTYTYPSLGNTIQVISTNVNPNGFFSSNENVNLIERVKIGDTYVPFTITNGVIYDILNATITNETINGYLTLETMKGIVQHPIPLDIDFAQPTITKLTPFTGDSHTPVIISGTNFYRITDVLFNDKKANFNLIQNTGTSHSLVAYVPEEATVGKVTVVSSLRDVSGISSQVFYPKIKVDAFSPTTGIWGTTVTISGKNFSGINGVYFGKTAAASYTSISQNLITAVAPAVNNGYSKGAITVRSDKNLSGSSKTIYKPLFPITGFSVISGTVADDMAIGVTYADTSYLYPQNGGYKVSFGNQISTFYKKDNYNFTGLIPPGFIGNNFISFYEPDGITKYPGFTGKFYGIGPAPEIGYNIGSFGKRNPKISPNNFPLFSTNSITIGGSNMKDFFGLSDYLVISGYGNEFKFSNITIGGNNDTVTVSNVRITGNPDINTGYYTVYLKNIAGTGNFVNSGILVTTPNRLIPKAAYVSRTGVLTNGTYMNAPYLSDNNLYRTPTADSISSLNIDYPLSRTSWVYWDFSHTNTVATIPTGGVHCLCYFYDGGDNPSQLNSIELFQDNDVDINGNIYRNFRLDGCPVTIGFNGILEILTGNNYYEAVFGNGVYSSSNNIAYSANITISGYKKVFDSPILNFKGIRIYNSTEITSNAIWNQLGGGVAGFPISEIKMY